MYDNSYTLKTIDGLISTTYILGIIVAIVFIVLSVVVANLINYEGGKNPRDASRRRMWFFILAVSGTIVFFLWNYLYVASLVNGAPAQDKFMLQMSIATAVSFATYLLVGFVMSKLMKKSKYGTIFP